MQNLRKTNFKGGGRGMKETFEYIKKDVEEGKPYFIQFVLIEIIISYFAEFFGFMPPILFGCNMYLAVYMVGRMALASIFMSAIVLNARSFLNKENTMSGVTIIVEVIGLLYVLFRTYVIYMSN